jgi:hypothetical protein
LESQAAAKAVRDCKDWINYWKFSSHKVLNLEINILKVKLVAHRDYIISRGLTPLQDIKDLLIGNLENGPYFAQDQKKTFDFSIREKLSVTNVRTPDEVKTFKIEDIDHLFPSRHYIPFLFPTDISDVYESNVDPKISYDLMKLKSKIRSNIKENVILRNIDELDGLFLSTKSLTWSNGKKGKGSKLRADAGFPTDFNRGTGNFEISFTTKTADDFRVIPISEISQRNLQYIVRESTERIHNAKYNVYGKPRWDYERWLDKKRNRFFIMVDQKKSGWTFPMELMTVYFEVVSEIYPDYEPFKLMERMFREKDMNYFTTQMPLFKPKRGFAIGLWDNIMSFILACSFELFLEEHIENDDNLYDIVNLDARFWGDDEAIRLDNCTYSQAMVIWNRWVKFLKSLGLEINIKKSFVSEYGILCEVYTQNGDINLNKTGVWLLQPLDSLRGGCTFHRKVLWTGYQDSVERSLPWFSERIKERLVPQVTELLDVTKYLIGVEFSNEEQFIPFQLGGFGIIRNEEGQSSLLSILLSKDIGMKWLRVACVGEYKGPWFYKNKEVVDKLLGNYYYSSILDNIADPFKKEFENIFREKLYKIPFYKEDKTLSDDKIWFELQSKRQKAYFDEGTSVSNMTVIEKLIREGEFNPFDLNPQLLPPITDENCLPFWENQSPHKGSEVSLGVRAIPLLIKKVLGKNPLMISFINEDRISIKDIVAEIYSEVSSSKCTVPTEWWAFARDSGFDVLKFQNYFEYKFLGEKLFRYHPPWRKEGIGTSHDLILGEGNVMFWDDYFGIAVPLNESELDMCRLNSYQRARIVSEKLGITEENYFELAAIRDFKIRDNTDEEILKEDIDYLLSNLPEIKNLLEESKEFSPDLTNIIRSDLILDVNQLLDFEDETYESSQELELDNDDPWSKYFTESNMEDVDLFGLGLLDNAASSDEEG